MKSFKQYIVEEGIEPVKPVGSIPSRLPKKSQQKQREEMPTRTGDQYTASVFRVDDKPLSSETKEYDFDAKGNSGPKGSFGKQKGITTRKGMFAAHLHEVAPYVVGRKTPFIFRIPQGSTRGTVYLQNKHREQIAARRPTLSAFDSRGFERLPSEEHFMETHRTPTPHSTTVIDDPIRFVSQFHDIKWVDDLTPFIKQFKNEKPSNISTTINEG